MSDPLALWGGLRLADGRMLGEAAEPFQKDDAAAILADDGPRLHYLTRPRGGSKTTDLAAAAIAALLEQLPAGGRAYAFAVDADQAGLLLDAVAGFAARTDGLAGALTVENYKATVNHSGAALRIMSADGASAFGALRSAAPAREAGTAYPASVAARERPDDIAGCRSTRVSIPNRSFDHPRRIGQARRRPARLRGE